MNQFRRAVSIENVLKAGVLDHQFESHGYNATNRPPKSDHLVFIASINYIFAGDISPETQSELSELGVGEGVVQTKAQEILNSDVDLERVIVRTLYDIYSLGMLVQKGDWVNNVLAHHPRLTEVIVPYMEKYPELVHDVTEKEFKFLYERFVRIYAPFAAPVPASMF